MFQCANTAMHGEFGNWNLSGKDIAYCPVSLDESLGFFYHFQLIWRGFICLTFEHGFVI
jgi:hypothetical protein